MFYSNIDRYGNNILVRGYDSDGKQVSFRDKFYPTFYIPGKVNAVYKEKWHTLSGRPVGPIQPGTMRDCKDFIEKYEDVANFDIYGTTNYVHQFIQQNFPGNIQFDKSLLNIATVDIEVASDDGFPEPSQARHEVITITIKNNNSKVFHTWGLYEFNSNTKINNKDYKINYKQCKSEKDLLSSFLEYWTTHYPDIITGWNSRLFDIPYLINRIRNLMGEKAALSFSPWRLINADNIIIGGKEFPAYRVTGIQQLDYLDLFKKFGYTYGQQENYKLDHIANVVLGEKKLDYSEYGTLHGLYKNDFQKFVEYNIIDVDLVDRLENKLGLITLVLTLAYKAKVNFVECFGTVGMWDAILYNYLCDRKIAIDFKRAGVKESKIEGAHVKDPLVGLHRWVVSFDLNSLYPHIMMQYNMSPETIVNDQVSGVTVDKLLDGQTFEFDKDQFCMTARGNMFSKGRRGIIPTIIEELYEERSNIKRKMLAAKQDMQNFNMMDKNENAGQTRGNTHTVFMPPTSKENIESAIVSLDCQQMAIKILMNSLYGATSNQFFRFFDVRIAESITMSGQLTIRWAEKTVNQYLNKILKTTDIDYIIAIDTDSLYVNFSSLVDQVFEDQSDKRKIIHFLDKVSKEKIEPLLNEAYTKLQNVMGCDRQMMVMAREVIADKGIWTGKKHYILNVWNNEGVQYNRPYLKMQGIEAVRSSTPAACRIMIKNTIKEIVNTNESEVQKYINNLREYFKTLPPEDIAFPRGVSNIEKWYDASSLYKKGTPINVRAAILYNKWINDNNIINYEEISSGNKMKFLYLMLPNPMKENVFGFVNFLPTEVDLHQYIDYNKQFDKGFLEPISTILTAIGWNAEKQYTLEDFFS